MLNKLNFINLQKNIINNFFALSSLQVVNMVIPILLLPYIIRIVGIEKYGLIAFSYATIQLFIIFVEFGFNYSATKLIAINKNNQSEVNKIFNHILAIKFLFLIISFILLLLLMAIFDKFNENSVLFLFAFGTVFGYVLTPSWFYQGIENMKILAIVNILIKVFFAILTVVIVDSKDDYLYVPLLQSLGFIFSGFILMIMAWSKYKIKYYKIDFQFLIYCIKDSYPIFISIGATSLYISANTLILGFTTNDTIVGYFNIAEKIARTVRMFFNPLVQAIFPSYSQKISIQDVPKSIYLIKKIVYKSLPIMIIGTTFLIFFAENILTIFGGKELGISSAKIDLIILSFILIFGTLNHMLGFLGLVNLGHQKEFSNYILSAGIMNILFVLLLSPVFYDIGTSISVVCSEVFLFALIINQLQKVSRR